MYVCMCVSARVYMVTESCNHINMCVFSRNVFGCYVSLFNDMVTNLAETGSDQMP